LFPISGGPKELVEDKANVPSPSRVMSMTSRAPFGLVTDPPLRERMGISARKSVIDRSWPGAFRKFLGDDRCLDERTLTSLLISSQARPDFTAPLPQCEKRQAFSMAYDQNTCAIVCTRDVLAFQVGLLRGLVCYDCDTNAREYYFHIANE